MYVYLNVNIEHNKVCKYITNLQHDIPNNIINNKNKVHKLIFCPNNRRTRQCSISTKFIMKLTCMFNTKYDLLTQSLLIHSRVGIKFVSLYLHSIHIRSIRYRLHTSPKVLHVIWDMLFYSDSLIVSYVVNIKSKFCRA